MLLTITKLCSFSFPVIFLGLLASSPLVRSQSAGLDTESQAVYGEYNFGIPTRGPWGIDSILFSTLFSNQSNATGYYPLSGPDLTVPASSTAPAAASGWSWNVGVRADIPVSDAKNNTNIDPSLRSKFFVGSEIYLQAPPATTVDPSWQVCVFRWEVNSNYSDALRHDDGTCSSVLSDSCRSDITKAAVASWNMSTGSARCVCPALTSISSCGTPPPAFNQGCAAYAYNATDINDGRNATTRTIDDWSDGKLLMQTYGGPLTLQGNVTAYNQTGSLSWPFMVIWGSNSGASTPSSQMTCIRATNATTGSEIPGSTSTESSNSRRNATFRLFTVILASILAGVWTACM